MKRFIAALCGVSLMLGLPLSVWGGDDLSKGAILDTIMQTAPNYTSYIAPEDIVSGYNDGDFRAEKLATDTEMLVMLSRAFPNMPVPQGNNLITMPKKADLSAAPEWAQKNLEYLNTRGIIPVGTVLDDSVTKDELTLYLRRIWKYYGNDIKDDFYTAVNHDKLSVARPVQDYFSGTFNDAAHANTQEVQDIITYIVNLGAKDEKQAKIKAVYLSALEMQRTSGGIEPLKPYLDKVKAVRNANDLTQAFIDCDKGVYTNGLITFGITVDSKNTSRYLPCVNLYEPSFTYEDFASDKYKTAFINYAKALFLAGGRSDADAQAKAEEIYAFEKGLSMHCLRSEDLANVEMTYNLQSFGDLCKEYGFIDLHQIALAEGFDLKDSDMVLVPDVGLSYNLAASCSGDRELTKDLSEISLLAIYAPLLSQNCTRASENFRNTVYGADGAMNYTVQERAVITTKNYMSDYISEMYEDMLLNDSDVKAVEEITKSIIANYKKKISSNTWMSEATKAKAINKLDKMGIKIGYGSGSADYLASARLSEEKTLFENTLEISAAAHKWVLEAKDKPVDRNMWAMAAYDANACYLPTTNEMVLPAGILKAPFYSSTASREENMGGIGIVIAHEISHAFDNTGAAYDEYGDYKNWWTETDYKHFSEKCSDIAVMFDGYESAAGVPTNGRLTVGEAIADLGALNCTAEVLRNSGTADMEKFYTSYAKNWETVLPREYIEMACMTDVHPANNVRVNLSLANLDDFVETFGIKEGDGMYIPKEERVGLW